MKITVFGLSALFMFIMMMLGELEWSFFNVLVTLMLYAEESSKIRDIFKKE